MVMIMEEAPNQEFFCGYEKTTNVKFVYLETNYKNTISLPAAWTSFCSTAPDVSWHIEATTLL